MGYEGALFEVLLFVTEVRRSGAAAISVKEETSGRTVPREGQVGLGYRYDVKAQLKVMLLVFKELLMLG